MKHAGHISDHGSGEHLAAVFARACAPSPDMSTAMATGPSIWTTTCPKKKPPG